MAKPENQKPMVGVTPEEQALIDSYKAAVKNKESQVRDYEKTKFRNNMLLGAATLACIGVSAALVAFPPVGVVGAITLAGLAAGGIATNIGEYFHKKECKSKLKGIKDAIGEQDKAGDKLVKEKLTLHRDKKTNETIIQKGGKEIDRIKHDDPKHFRRANKVLDFIRRFLPKIGETVKSKIDSSKVHKNIYENSEKVATEINKEVNNLLNKVNESKPIEYTSPPKAEPKKENVEKAAEQKQGQPPVYNIYINTDSPKKNVNRPRNKETETSKTQASKKPSLRKSGGKRKPKIKLSEKAKNRIRGKFTQKVEAEKNQGKEQSLEIK
jgi:hypothetical protein